MNTPSTGLDILNIGSGDIEIRFDEKDVLEKERAKRIIEDMLKRGYSLFIHGKDKALIRVKKFLPKTGHYVVADGPTVPPEAEPVEERLVTSLRQRGRPRKVSMGSVKATVVGRSAGG